MRESNRSTQHFAPSIFHLAPDHILFALELPDDAGAVFEDHQVVVDVVHLLEQVLGVLFLVRFEGQLKRSSEFPDAIRQPRQIRQFVDAQIRRRRQVFLFQQRHQALDFGIFLVRRRRDVREVLTRGFLQLLHIGIQRLDDGVRVFRLTGVQVADGFGAVADDQTALLKGRILGLLLFGEFLIQRVNGLFKRHETASPLPLSFIILPRLVFEHDGARH